MVLSDGTRLDSFQYVGQVGLGQGGLHNRWDRMKLGQGVLQIRWDRMGLGRGGLPAEPVHLSQSGTTRP